VLACAGGLAGCLQTGLRSEPCEVSAQAVVVDVPVVRQEELHECGLATMASLLAYYSVPFPAEERARLARLARRGEGLSGAELRDGLRRLGLQAFVLLGSGDEGVHHYALLTGYEPAAADVYLFDPARGHVRVTRDEFLARWRETGGFTLLAFPPSNATHG
jgi:ABC-type bacteriocin/lantibiotic exporter with double-glycine peptidase domain